LMVLIIS